ncbi:MAG: hypothetical protein IJW00_09795 [Clostridia bacterium]|nr:hypothetical protein [Clostridia bacterium]
MKQAKVIILAGQSNAVGVGFVKYLPKYFDEKTVVRLTEGFEHIKTSYASHDIQSEGFVKTTVNCTEETKDTFGPELGMADHLNEIYPDEEFFIVKCAFGGSDMFNGWRSPASGVPYLEKFTAEPKKALVDPAYQFPGWCYNALVKRLRGSLDELVAAGYEPKIIGFCWMQGEADSAPPHAEPYIGRYDCMLRDLQETFAPYFDECVFVDAGISEIWVDYAQMNDRKRAYAEASGHKFVDTIAAGLTTRYEPEEEPDIYHYDAGSVIKLGRMFAEGVMKR